MINSHDPDTWPTNFILASSHHRYQYPRHHSYVITTSSFLICHKIITSSHHHGTHRLSSKKQVWASSRVLWRSASKTTSRSLPVMESGGGGLIEGKCPQSLQHELDKGEVPSIASNKKTTGGATGEVVREDSWPDAAWPDSLGRPHQLQQWNNILLDE